MKRRSNKIFTIFITLLFAVLFISFSGNPPNGTTGAPGDSLCTGCHSNSNPNGFAATVDVLNFPTTITPNTTYNLQAQVTYTAGTPVRAGFQAVVLDASNNNSGDLSTNDPNVATAFPGSREYVEHDPSLSFGAGTSVTYNFDWEAPNVPNGEVITIYIASLIGNGANGNGGDLTITNNFSGTVDNGGSSPPTLSATSTDVSCFGGNDGTATASASGGAPGYTYAWSNGGSGENITNLTAGTYTVTVTDINSLTATATTQVGQPSQITVTLISQTNVDCFGNNNGAATVIAIGGTTPGYNYIWSNGGNSSSVTNLPAGTYTVTVSDANSCTNTEQVTITQPNPISLVATSTDVSCNGENDGSATGIGNGGTGGITYSWSNGMFGQTISNLAPGTYTVTATDANFCTQTETTIVNQPNAISLTTTSTNINCNGDNNGTATAFGSGGGGGFTYNWSNGLNGQTISNLPGGTYTVTATDANNCFEVGTVNVLEPSAITLSILPTNISCNGQNDGSATAIGNGGTGSILYNWSNGMSGQTITNLSAGTYTVTATDENNCGQVEMVSITESSAISVNITDVDISCNGENDGTATAFGSGGAGGFSYTWSNGMNGQTISNLAPGTYTASATDANNCVQTETVNITEPTPVVVTITQNDILCNGDNNGSATASGNGGTGGFSYLWSNGTNGSTISNLSAGTYTVTATDANNCTEIEMVTFSEPTEIVVTIIHNDINCNGENNGEAMASANGGISGFSYSWSNGMNGQSIFNLTPGTYTVSATDANNCVQTETVTITEPDAITLTITQNNILCNGANNGSATATANGGVSGFSYLWSNNVSGQTISNLPPGTYTTTATDANGCTNTEMVTITESSAITLNIFQNEISCNGENDGSATASGNGGAGNFNYTWSNGMSGATISNLSAGTYTASATDANNCLQIETITLTEPDAITITVTQNDVDCNGNNNGSATASAIGGTGNITYNWSNGMSGQSISNLAPGTYTVSSTDVNNCEETESIIITEPNAITISITQTDVNCFGENNGSATASGSGGANGFSYAWSNGMSGQTISNLSAGTYTVTATDAINCTQLETVTIEEPNNLIVNASATGETGSSANDGTATAAPSGGISGYTFLWSTGSSNSTISNLAPGSYTVTITDNNMCTAEETVIVSAFDCSISIDVTTIDPLCFGETGSATASSQNGTNPISFLWSTGETTATISNLTPGITYSVTATDSNNCPASMSIIISEPSQLLGTASTTPVSCNGGSDGTVNITVTGGTAPFTYIIPNNGINLPAGFYVATVTDANNCMTMINFEITEPDAIAPNATATDVTANGANDGTATSNPSGGIGNFSYNWSNGMITSMIENLAPGDYTVTVSDENNCSATQTVTVNDVGCAVGISTTFSNVTCFDEINGTATVAVTSGVAPFNYLWSNGATTETINNLIAGIYTVTVTDANNCPVSESVTITQPALLILSQSPQSVLSIDCFGNNNGIAAIDVEGGTSSYTYVWSNGAMTNPISNLPAGTFTGTVTDANGCIETISFTITEPTELLTNSSSTNETASNANNGTASASPSGGTGTYTYLWSNGGTTSSISNLAPGTYTVTVTDINNCESIESVDIIAFGCTLTATVSTINATCSDATDGSATATPTGGQNYTYNWSSGGTMATENNLAPGTYTVTINDASNCIWVETITIDVVDNVFPMAITQNISVSLDGNGDASIVPSMIDNGSSDNCGIVTLDADILSFDCDDLGENVVTLTVTDMAGNQTTANATVTVNDLLPPTLVCPTNIIIDDCTGLVVYDPPTFFDNCGAVVITFTGPMSGEIFPFGETLVTISASDISGNVSSCTFSVTIDHVLGLTAIATDSPCAGDNLGMADASSTGTSQPFNYVWSTGATTPNIMNLAPNNYTVTVTDGSGCTSTSEVIVNEPDSLELIIDDITDESAAGANDGAIEITVNGGTPPYVYGWTNGTIITTLEDPTGLPGGSYALNVTDANGCNLAFLGITVGTMVDNENLILEKDIRLFPNPASDQLFLDFDLPANYDFNISIHDAVGKVLLQKTENNISNQKLDLDISNLTGGLYFVKIQTGDQFWIRKFIIQ